MLTRQQFLTQHPAFAAVTGDSDRVRVFLQNHPDIAQAWAAIVAAEKPKAPGAAAASPTAVAPVAAPAGPTSEQMSAQAVIRDTLDSFGLGALGDWAWGQYLNGTPTSKIMLDLRARPEYKARFSGMDALAKAGRAITEQEYISQERQYASTMRAFGLPASFYDGPEDFGALIGGGVSAQEFNDRAQMAAQVVATNPQAQQLRDELGRLYGLSNADGLAIGYWIDPNKGADIIKKQFLAAQTAAASTESGFGSLSKDQAELVSGTGVTADQARQGFTQLAGLHELNTGLVGDAGDTGVSKDTMIGAAFTGDAKAQEALKKETRRRTAVNDAGGGYAAGQGGVSGLGSANR